MLSSICPLGERARHSRWSITVAAYLIGSAVGGLALGLLSAMLGGLVPAHWRASPLVLCAVAVAMAVGLAFEARVVRRPIPSWRRQVDEQWLTRYRGWVYGLGFGAQLGFGVVTIVTSATTYAVIVAAALTGVPAAGAGIGGLFGLVRALPVVALGRVDHPHALHRLFRRLERWGRPAERAAAAGLAAAALTLVAVAATR